MKINFWDIWFKNFLSYGNVWNHIPLDKGINFLIGPNGFGKSSTLMAISFAAFGKVQKNIVKADIVNWQNNKKCEVELHFYKENNFYIIRRGLKPNYLEIEIDGVVQPKDSDVRVTQKNIEEKILGFNFDIFNNLVFCNLNNTISILDTTALKKRKFIEDLFSDMEYFSDLMEKTKKKLKNIDSKTTENNTKIDFQQKNIDNLKNEINNLEIPNISKEHEEYIELKGKYEDLIEKNDIKENEITEIETKLKEKNNEIVEQENKRKDLNDKIRDEKYKKENLNNQIKETEKLEKYKKEIKEIEKYLKKNKKNLKKYDEKKKELDNINKNIDELINDKNKLNASIEGLEEQKKKLNPSEDLKNESNCPTCGSKVDYEKVKEYFDKEKKELHEKVEELHEKVKNIDEELHRLKTNNEILEKETKELYEITNKYFNEKIRKENLEELTIDIKNKDEINKEISTIEENILEYENSIKEINEKINNLLWERDEIDFDLKTKKKIVEDIKETKEKLNLKKLSYEHKKSNKEDIKKRIENKETKITEIEDEINNLKEKNKKLINLKGYFDYLKESLKDENIRSYIISIIIPYLNQKVNEYLVELGFDFYLEFNNQLDVSIYGPNARACSIGSMSGGESKSIDLITKFALMNIAKTKAKYYPDLLLLDEILDSSIDVKHLEQLMGIIKYEQKKDNLKVFIISHREEINNISIGKIYNIKNKNGFSQIEEN